MCGTFFKVPVTVLLEEADGAGPKPLCLFDVAIEFGAYDDRSDTLADVFAFLQIGGAFEWSKSK